jgi:hypothetical protein
MPSSTGQLIDQIRGMLGENERELRRAQQRKADVDRELDRLQVRIDAFKDSIAALEAVLRADGSPAPATSNGPVPVPVAHQVTSRLENKKETTPVVQAAPVPAKTAPQPAADRAAKSRQESTQERYDEICERILAVVQPGRPLAVRDVARKIKLDGCSPQHLIPRAVENDPRLHVYKAGEARTSALMIRRVASEDPYRELKADIRIALDRRLPNAGDRCLLSEIAPTKLSDRWRAAKQVLIADQEHFNSWEDIKGNWWVERREVAGA